MTSRKILALVFIFIGVGVIVSFGILSLINSRRPTAGLKVETTPPALVFVDNAQIGQTPIDRQFPPGEVSVKIIPSSNDQPLTTYQTKVRLTDRVYTVIRRQFGQTENESAGETVSLQPQSQKSASLAVVTSSPTSASVTLDGEPQGFTPVLIPSISPGDHQVAISAPGYTPRTVSAQALSGYRLTLNVKLASSPPSPTPPPPTATISATPKVSPTVKTGLTPTPSSKPTGPTLVPTPILTKPYVTILDTPTGFLRVRSGPGSQHTEIGQVKPGSSHPLLDSSPTSWYLIKVELAATSSGWISGEYAQKFQ